MLSSAARLLPLVALVVGLTAAEPPVQREPETPAQHDARMQWWREAKFGMFIHWGLYAIPADGEWHMRKNQVPLATYAQFAEQFNPVRFNADEWAALAKDAGMRLMVLTTKHHDGFAMFDSQASSYNIVAATPFKRDPLKELADACPKFGLKLGTYYSVIADWGHPGGGAGCPKWDPAQEGDLDHYINTVSVPQVRELLTKYGPIAVMWFDSDGANVGTAERASRYAPVLKLQPDLIVNPRLQNYPGDFQTCEGHIPMYGPNKDWELCTKTNTNWGYTAGPTRTRASLLRELAEAWGKGGTVLLNVGPDRTGVIPAESAARLREVGAWLTRNGTAIYGSVRGPFDYLPWGWATRTGDTLHLLVRDWPADGKLVLPSTVPCTKAWLEAEPQVAITVQSEGDRTVLTLPAQAPDPAVSVIALTLNGPVAPTRSLLLGKPITASESQKSAGNANDDDSGTSWRIPSQTATLSVDMGSAQTFSVLRLTTPYTSASRITLEVQVGAGWQTVYEDAKPSGTGWVRSFPPVTGQVVRLSVTADKPGIRVGDFDLFPPL